MQIVKVEPLAKINAIFSERAGTGEYNIDGFDTRRGRGQKRKGRSIGVRARGRFALFIESSLWNCEHRYNIVYGARERLKGPDLFPYMSNTLCKITAEVNRFYFPSQWHAS